MGRPASISYKQGKTVKIFPLDDYSSMLPPALRPGIKGGDGGAEVFIVHEFVSACVEKRKPVVDVYKAVAFSAPGICGHQSALKGGEWVKVPDFGQIS